MISTMQIGAFTLQLRRKSIKHLHISVLPPDGRIRVAVPEKMTETAIRMAVISRIPWIKKQQLSFSRQPRQTCRMMVSGESHYLFGQRCRLHVTEQVGKHEVKAVNGNKLLLRVNPGTSQENKALALNEYYRSELKLRIEPLMARWQNLVGVQASEWGVKKMKTKWGSCNAEAKRIWLNLELAKKPPECLEYILVHELIHLLERNHNERFRTHMERLIPNWIERRNLLNSLPLAHENWDY